MRKMISALLATSIVAAMSVSAFAAVTPGTNETAGTGSIDFGTKVYDSDYKEITGTDAPVISNNTIDKIRPDTTYYIPFNKLEKGKNNTGNANLSTSGFEETNVIGNKDLYKVSFEKDGDGRGLIDSISIVSDKKGDSADNTYGNTRGAWLKIVTKQSFSDSEKKAKITIEVKAKSAKEDEIKKSDFKSDNNGKLVSGDKYVTTLNLWVNNVTVNGDSADQESGDAFVFKPSANEENTIVWGDDRAALKFDADDDASKFYAKLSTKTIPGFWAEYADPVGADLWFYDFVGNPSIPSTSRATLTLGIPWEDDDSYAPKVGDVYIYHMDKDGVLTDVTSDFSYSEDAAEIPGWSIKTRTLGTYILSDMELPIDGQTDSEDTSSSDTEDTTSTTTTPAPENNAGGDKEIPSTGSADMVNVAVVGAVASLAAAGAVAFRKK